MNCLVCAGSGISDDVSVVGTGKRVILQGKIYAIISPDEAIYSPFSDYFTVSIYPRRGRVKYLKFKTWDELDRWGFIREAKVRVRGCLHRASNGIEKEVVFDVTEVEFP